MCASSGSQKAAIFCTWNHTFFAVTFVRRSGTRDAMLPQSAAVTGSRNCSINRERIMPEELAAIVSHYVSRSIRISIRKSAWLRSNLGLSETPATPADDRSSPAWQPTAEITRKAWSADGVGIRRGKPATGTGVGNAPSQPFCPALVHVRISRNRNPVATGHSKPGQRSGF